MLKLYLRMHGCKVGKGLKCKSWPIFRGLPNKNIYIGDHVGIGYNITFEPFGKGIIIIRDYVNLTQNIIISASDKVYIGNHSGVAEYVSIRDNEHKVSKDKPWRLQETFASPVWIGDDVGIGLGCAILRGARIEDGAIIGAHSIITRNTKIVKNGIYFGFPLKMIGKRTY